MSHAASAAAMADSLVRMLEAVGISAVKGVHPRGRIEDERLIAELRLCDAMIAIATQSYVTEPAVRREARELAERGRPLLAVLIDVDRSALLGALTTAALVNIDEPDAALESLISRFLRRAVGQSDEAREALLEAVHRGRRLSRIPGKIDDDFSVEAEWFVVGRVGLPAIEAVRVALINANDHPVEVSAVSVADAQGQHQAVKTGLPVLLVARETRHVVVPVPEGRSGVVAHVTLSTGETFEAPVLARQH